MTALRDFDSWPRAPLHLAIGVFDGVHRGHQALIAKLKDGCRGTGATALAATFDPLPIQFFAPNAPPSALSDVDGRRRRLQDAGADHVVVFRFDAAFAALSPEEFTARIAGAGDVKRIVVGEDFQFGHERAGNVDTLARLCPRFGCVLEVMPPIKIDGEIVSSTRVRNALLAGDLDLATRLLGRAYDVRGTVVHGEKRGRALGFPTINLAVPRERLLPRDGIYAMRVRIGDRDVGAAASLGVRPTFGGGDRTLEAFLLDWEGELYGESVEASFVTRLRDELRFASAAELSAQIARDVEQARRALR